MNTKDVIIIGGGFYGLSVALYLAEVIGIKDVTIFEKESSLMSRASYVNQARVHAGYHYPRSMLTGYRSAVNFPRFVDEYRKAVVDDFDKFYAISRQLSKVNSRQFEAFCHKIGVEINAAPADIQKLFNHRLTESVFKVKEYAFDSHILRDLLVEKIKIHPGIRIQYEKVLKIQSDKENGILVSTEKAEYDTQQVFNCSYSEINNLHRASGLPLIPVKHEITEMCLVKMPIKFKDFSVTVMDGPFFSIVPFPSRPGLHTLSHVRYTPHESWVDNDATPDDQIDPHRYFSERSFVSQYRQMYADVVRYIPELGGMEYVDSIREVKTTLVKSEDDDSRPILFKPHFGMHGYTCIMGGKLDNIYDVFEELGMMYGEKN